MRGLFITFEGIEGAGKSTQIKMLKRYLKENGYQVISTREPGGTYIGDEIRDILLDIDNHDMDYKVEALLYAASRAQLVKNIISPALSRGKIVLSDRYTDSSLAYQAFGRELPFDMILEINHWATSCLDPDLTFYLKLPVEEGMRRVSTREADRIEAEEISFHRKVESGYRELIEMHPERFSIVNGVSTKQEIHENIIKRVNELLESRK